VDLQSKKSILTEFYKYLKNKGYNNFKSKHLEIGKPIDIVEKQTGGSFEPDLTATYKSKPYIFEIETPEDIKLSKEKFVKKCNTFLSYTASKNGKFYLIVPVLHFDKVFSELNKYNLENVGILQINYS